MTSGEVARLGEIFLWLSGYLVVRYLERLRDSRTQFVDTCSHESCDRKSSYDMKFSSNDAVIYL